MDRFVCIDVEMPNGDNDRISAIGVAEFVGGVVTQRFYALINPETWFQPYVIELIGITPDIVSEMPEELLDAIFDTGDLSDPQLRDAWEVAKGLIPAEQ